MAGGARESDELYQQKITEREYEGSGYSVTDAAFDPAPGDDCVACGKTYPSKR